LAAAAKDRGPWASAGIAVTKRLKTAIQREAFATAKTLPKAVGCGVSVMDLLLVFTVILLLVIEIIIQPMPSRNSPMPRFVQAMRAVSQVMAIVFPVIG